LLPILPPYLFTPLLSTITIFLILSGRDVTYFDTSVFILYFAGFDDTTQLLRKPIRLQGNEETKPMCAKPVSMSLGMAVALHRSFERKCHLRQPNILLNNRLRLCSAVAVSNIRLRLCIVVAVLK